MDSDVFRGFGIPVTLAHSKTQEEYDKLSLEERKELNKDSFLKIRETLTRIGVASRKEKNLYQSCHILHKRGNYAILHFKELFALDGKSTNLDSDDLARRNRIALLLDEWGLLKITNPVENVAPLNYIKIIKHPEKHEWNLVAKYSVGKKRI
jgi:hypothetical protein